MLKTDLWSNIGGIEVSDMYGNRKPLEIHARENDKLYPQHPKVSYFPNSALQSIKIIKPKLQQDSKVSQEL